MKHTGLAARLLLVGSLFLLGSLPSLAQNPGDKESLRGIGRIAINLPSPSDQDLSDGITSDMLRDMVGARLDAAGIPYTWSALRNPSPASQTPILYIVWHAMKDPDSSRVYYSLTMQLNQFMTMPHSVNLLAVTTWSTRNQFGFTVGGDGGKEVMVHDFPHYLDNFIADYKSVNPPPASTNAPMRGFSK